MMGEVVLHSHGVPHYAFPVPINAVEALNSEFDPREAHLLLWGIEQSLMPADTGKRFEFEIVREHGDPLIATFQDFDWADEVLHARVGRDWYVSEFENAKEAVEYGDRCWSKVLMGWREWRDKGLTQHRNWWPDIYRAACDRWRTPPEEKVLAYDTTYESTRADLKVLAASA